MVEVKNSTTHSKEERPHELGELFRRVEDAALFQGFPECLRALWHFSVPCLQKHHKRLRNDI